MVVILFIGSILRWPHAKSHDCQVRGRGPFKFISSKCNAGSDIYPMYSVTFIVEELLHSDICLFISEVGVSPTRTGRKCYLLPTHSTHSFHPVPHDWKEGNVLFNNALKTFYLRLYGVKHMVKDHSHSERGNLLPPHGLLFPISSKGSFICIIQQT